MNVNIRPRSLELVKLLDEAKNLTGESTYTKAVIKILKIGVPVLRNRLAIAKEANLQKTLTTLKKT